MLQEDRKRVPAVHDAADEPSGPDGPDLRAMAAAVFQAAQTPRPMTPSPVEVASSTPPPQGNSWRWASVLVAGVVVSSGVFATVAARGKGETPVPPAATAQSPRARALLAMSRAPAAPAGQTARVAQPAPVAETAPAARAPLPAAARPRSNSKPPLTPARPRRERSTGPAQAQPEIAATDSRTTGRISATDAREVDRLLQGLSAAAPSPAKKPLPEAEAPPPLGRAEILAAMKPLRPRIKECYRQLGGQGRALSRIGRSQLSLPVFPEVKSHG